MAEIKAAKHLGQHFLTDDSVIATMVHAIRPQPNDTLVEIGPGLGALTLPILTVSGRLTAIELDRRVLAPLAAKAAKIGQLTLIEADVLTVNFAELSIAHPINANHEQQQPTASTSANTKIRLIGNLPYNLSSPILFHCLAQRQHIADMHFMLQKEVVARITAEPGGKDYGRLSLMLQQHLHTENLFSIPPDAFEPPPKVDSAVVRLVPRAAPAWNVHNDADFARIIRIAFSQRRKMLRKSLGQWFDSATLEHLGINPAARPETLSGAEFAQLANHLTTNQL